MICSKPYPMQQKDLNVLEDDIKNVDDDMDDSPCQNLNYFSEDWFDISANGMKELQDMIVRCLSN